jgi:hypothetical protein
MDQGSALIVVILRVWTMITHFFALFGFWVGGTLESACLALAAMKEQEHPTLVLAYILR